MIKSIYPFPFPVTVPHAHGAPHPAGQYRRLDRPPPAVPTPLRCLSSGLACPLPVIRRGDTDLRAMAHAMLKIMFGSDFPAPLATGITG